MIPEEEVLKYIHDMGYVTVKPRVLNPSYYKLSDGTIIKAIVEIHALLPDPKNPDGFSIVSTNIINAFTPKENRNPAAFVTYTNPQLNEGIVDDDVDYEVLRENFSVYELNNGFVLSVKTVVGQIQKSKFFTRDGEPVYKVNTNPIIKMKKPKS